MGSIVINHKSQRPPSRRCPPIHRDDTLSHIRSHYYPASPKLDRQHLGRHPVPKHKTVSHFRSASRLSSFSAGAHPSSLPHLRSINSANNAPTNQPILILFFLFFKARTCSPKRSNSLVSLYIFPYKCHHRQRAPLSCPSAAWTTQRLRTIAF